MKGGLIDIAHHDSLAKKALEETLQFEEAVKVAASMTNQEDTLLIVTADHSHPFSLAGYTKRGNPVLGLKTFFISLYKNRLEMNANMFIDFV